MDRYTRKHSRTAPRSFFSLYLRLGGWLSLILGGLLVVLTLISATQLYIADALDRDGKFATAVVLEKRFAVTVDDDGDETTRYYATFRFKDSATGGRDQERSVNRGFYTSTQQGNEVEIRYLRSDPSTFEYEIGQYRRGGTIVRYIGLAFGIAGLVALWVFGRQASDALAARKHGEKRLASVTEIRDTNIRVQNLIQARLIWEEKDGQTGQSLMRDRTELSTLFRAGDQIVVFRLGDKAFWEGDVGPPKREVTD